MNININTPKGESEKTAENGSKGENQPDWKAGRTRLSKLKEEIKKKEEKQ